MKKLIILLISLFLFTPFVHAISDKYVDNIANIVGKKIDEDKINIYLFYSESCPHCHDEIEYLDSIKDKYDINIYMYEVTKDEDNNVLMKTVKNLYSFNGSGVPFTVIGEEYIYGFSDTVEEKIEGLIKEYLEVESKVEKDFKIPILGKVNAKKTSISLIAIILGFIDGFNPCAMWILLLLINMTLSVKSRKKLFIIGLTFILTGGVIYFLSMLGISFIIDFVVVNIIRNIIAGVAIILGIYNLYTYYKTRKDTGCHVVKEKKRKTIISKIKDIMSKKSMVLAILGTIVLAASVNLVELACSLGFPTIFLEILSINNILGFQKIVYLLLYILFYLIDDLIIFMIAVFTLKQTGITTKYNKFVNLVGGILMILMGILLIFKPDWIMLNF